MENTDENKIPAPPAPVVPASEIIPQQEGHLKPLQTYASDMANAVKESHGSVVKIAMAEQERRRKEEVNVSPTSKKNLIFIGGGVVLMILAVISVIFFMSSKNTTVQVASQAQQAPSIIATDAQKEIDITTMGKNDIGSAVAAEITGTTQQINTIEQLVLVKTINGQKALVGTQGFFSALESSAPDSLVRSLGSSPTLGIHSFNGNDLFIAFHTDSYPTAFAGMLAWEPTLFDDMYQLFGISVAGNNSGLFNAKFVDTVIENQDARALLDSTGKVAFFYTFLGEHKDTLVITTKESTLNEVVNRLQATTVKQ